MPDFSTMTRKQLFDAVKAFEEALTAKGSLAEAKKFYDEQLDGIGWLKPAIIPNEWV